MKRQIKFNVNGREYRVEADPSMRLLDLIRDVLCLTITKEKSSEDE